MDDPFDLFRIEFFHAYEFFLSLQHSRARYFRQIKPAQKQKRIFAVNTALFVPFPIKIPPPYVQARVVCYDTESRFFDDAEDRVSRHG